MSTLVVVLEKLETKFANASEASGAELDLYQRTAGGLRRLLELLGIKGRRAIDVTPPRSLRAQSVAAGAIADQQAVERGEDEIRALPVFLSAAGQHEIVDRHAVVAATVERLRKEGAAVGLERFEQRLAVEPAELAQNCYRIIDVVGVSETSWEDAGVEAVETAAGSLRDPRVAEVTKMDMKVDNGKVTAFRTRVALSFKYEAE